MPGAYNGLAARQASAGCFEALYRGAAMSASMALPISASSRLMT